MNHCERTVETESQPGDAVRDPGSQHCFDSPPGEEPNRRSAQVLVADDDPGALASLTRLLEHWGYEAIGVTNGADTLSRLCAHDGPRLALVDWMLPDICGPEICRRLRAAQTLHYTYIVLLTGRDEATDVVEGLAAGADDYVRKPYEPMELQARLSAGYRVITHKALRESEQRFQGAFEHAGVGMTLAGLDGRFLQVNRALCQFLGYSSDELLAMNFQSLTHPDDLAESLASVQQFLAGDLQVRELEKRYVHKDGHVVWGLVTLSAIRDEKGNPAYFVAQVQNISKRKATQEALREREAQLQLLLDSTAEAIYGVDINGNCTFCNRSCLNLLGYEHAADLLGKPMHSLIHHSYADGAPFPMERCQIHRPLLQGEGSHVDSEVMWRADGTCFPSE